MKSRKSRKSAKKRITKSKKAGSTTTSKKIAGKTPAIKDVPPNPNDPREKALALMKKGVSQAAAAKSEGITIQRLARYRRATTTSKMKNRKWVIRDLRPSEMFIASNGKVLPIAVRYRAKSTVGHYWNAVNEFLMTNDPSSLVPHAGLVIRDIKGKKHVVETGPNTLRMLDAIGELSFIQIYANVAK